MKSSRRLEWVLVGLIVLLLLSICLGIAIGPVQILVMLLAGWVFYLIRVIPQIQLNSGGVATIVICLLALALLGHLMARWLWREVRTDAPSKWRLRWTLSLIAIVVLMFVAGIGAVGATHQTAWLARSNERMFEYRSRETANRVKCASNMRQLGAAITMYAQEHDNHLPDSLPTLLKTIEITPGVFVCPSSSDEQATGATTQQWLANFREINCSYVYHGAGLHLPLPADRPILCEPLLNHDGDGMNILYADGSVQWLMPAEAEAALRTLAR